MSFLHKKIINFDPEIFGLDLSDLSIKVFQFEKEGRTHKIRSFYSMDIAPGDIEDGKIIKKDKVVAAIKEAINKAGPKKINTNKVVCSLPESKVFLRIISIPRMSEEEAGEAIKWEMEANIPLPIDQVYFDWQLLESPGGAPEKNGGESPQSVAAKQNILTVAASREIVDDLIEVLDRAGLEAYGLEVESIASVRSLISQKNLKKAKTALIVDLGAQRSSFIVVEDGAPYFTSSIPFSSEGIDDAISKRMSVDKREAEKIKISHGIEYSKAESPVFRAVESLLENLILEIEKTLDFYSGMNKQSTGVEKIILCGGGANLKGLVPYLTQRLAKEVEVGDPWSNVSLGNNLPLISKENAVRYSTVIGLALKDISYEN